MKIGIIAETKVPEDNRVILSPKQVAQLKSEFSDVEFVVQTSSIRAYSDDMYRAEGIEVVGNVKDCDVLFGIKEANIGSLIPNKHYFFFGHIAKMQEYNRPLLQTMIKKQLTFSDYEYLVDEQNNRLCAFGWWAGVVGVYYTLRGYGLKYNLYELPKPTRQFTLEQLFDALKSIELPKVKILVTGNGRVSKGAQYVLENIGTQKMNVGEYLTIDEVDKMSYCVAGIGDLVKRKDGSEFSRNDFSNNASEYESDFMRFAKKTDVLISAHFWGAEAPVYLSEEDLRDKDFRIRMIGDITCDIKGSIKSTVRPSTHSDPYYDYNPLTEQEEPAFSSLDNITEMAVDTCPNALAIDASVYFGEMLMQHVLRPLLKGESSDVIERATIVKNGELTKRFSYLNSFANNQ